MRRIAIFALLAAAPSLAQSTFRRNNAHTGVYQGAGPKQLGGVKWAFKAGGPIVTSPAIADGVVYFGAMDGNLHAVVQDTGQEKWKAQLNILTSSPGVHGNRVFVGDADGKFYCLDRADGKVLWTFETEGQITAAPNFDGDHVLIPTHNSTLYCLDKDGKKVWEFRIEGPIYGGVAVTEGKTFLAGCDSQMHVLDVKTGKELGSVDLKGQSGAGVGSVPCGFEVADGHGVGVARVQRPSRQDAPHGSLGVFFDQLFHLEGRGIFGAAGVGGADSVDTDAADARAGRGRTRWPTGTCGCPPR